MCEFAWGMTPKKTVDVIGSPGAHFRPADSFPRKRPLKSVPGARGSRPRGTDFTKSLHYELESELAQLYLGPVRPRRSRSGAPRVRSRRHARTNGVWTTLMFGLPPPRRRAAAALPPTAFSARRCRTDVVPLRCCRSLRPRTSFRRASSRKKNEKMRKCSRKYKQ